MNETAKLTQNEFDEIDTVLVHLVDDETRSRTICSGLPWTAPKSVEYRKSKLCPACQRIAMEPPCATDH